MSIPGKLPSGADYAPPVSDLDILHLDPHVIAVAKPHGLLSVPGKEPWLADCLEARVRAAFPDALLLHRLDMDTSGVMIFARTRLAQRHLYWQFERRQLSKTYEARVWGVPDGDEGTIDLPLVCDWPRRPLQKVCHETGKPARTRWRKLSAEKGTSRMQLIPETGRSHQLRVHMLALGHPILGDRFYAQGDALAAAHRLMLHASNLRFRHPDGGAWMSVDAPVPF